MLVIARGLAMIARGLATVVDVLTLMHQRWTANLREPTRFETSFLDSPPRDRTNRVKRRRMIRIVFRIVHDNALIFNNVGTSSSNIKQTKCRYTDLNNINAYTSHTFGFDV